MQSIKISEEYYNMLKEISEKTGKSLKDLIENALSVVYKNNESMFDKEIAKIKQGIINVKYKTYCSVCKREINEGELAYWVKYEFTDKTTKTNLICLDCFYNEKGLAKLYIKKKELTKIIKGLDTIAQELYEEIEKYRLELKTLELKAEIRNLLYLFGEDKEKAEILDKINELADKLSALELEIRSKIKANVKKRKVEVSSYE